MPNQPLTGGRTMRWLTVAMLLTLPGCASQPRWNDQSRTVSEAEFVAAMHDPGPTIKGWGWQYAGSYGGYE